MNIRQYGRLLGLMMITMLVLGCTVYINHQAGLSWQHSVHITTPPPAIEDANVLVQGVAGCGPFELPPARPVPQLIGLDQAAQLSPMEVEKRIATYINDLKTHIRLERQRVEQAYQRYRQTCRS